MKPKRKNRTYNPVLLLFYRIMRMIFFPIYLTGKIIEILSTLIVPASATLYLIFLVYDVYTIIRDGFVFPSDIDKLKDNYLMVSFIIKMAHEMGLHVCIEGVETKEELSCVKKLGADYIQGYYYGKQVCLQDFEEQHLKRFVLG